MKLVKKTANLNRLEMTLDEFISMPMKYTLGVNGANGAHRMYRNDEFGVQKEVVTEPKHFDNIYGGWKDPEIYYFLDGDKRTFRTADECYAAYMEKVMK